MSKKLVNPFDDMLSKLAAPSNRRSEGYILPPNLKLRWSIDRITIVGKAREHMWYHNGTDVRDVDFRKLMRLNEGAFVRPVGETAWKIVDRFGENIAYIELLRFTPGNARIDFNPNKIKTVISESLKTFIHTVFIEPHFSRADVACDIINVPDDFITEYRYIEPVTYRVYYDKKGNMETTYWGSRSSEQQIRLYNKKVEQIKKRNVLPKEIETWWRFELQLRRGKATNWASMVVDSLSKFNNPLYVNGSSNAELTMLDGLIANHKRWGGLSKKTKSKYKKLLNSAEKNDTLTKAMIDIFLIEQRQLKDELDTWLRGYDVTP